MTIRKLSAGARLVIATHNTGKIREFADLLARFEIATVSARELDLPEPEETGHTFEANALIKARNAADSTRLPALADDSGLEVAGLNGAPGIHSARWAGPEKDFTAAMQRVKDELTARQAWTATGRKANFNATLVLAWPDDGHMTFDGKVFGTLQWPPRGTNGFGYDPMFQPDGCEKTFGEMTSEEKHGARIGPSGSGPSGSGLSHRARACEHFIRSCIDDG